MDISEGNLPSAKLLNLLWMSYLDYYGPWSHLVKVVFHWLHSCYLPIGFSHHHLFPFLIPLWCFSQQDSFFQWVKRFSKFVKILKIGKIVWFYYFFDFDFVFKLVADNAPDSVRLQKIATKNVLFKAIHTLVMQNFIFFSSFMLFSYFIKVFEIFSE